MFGYIRPVERELRIRESEYYRALYCGICTAMGRLCGQRSRLTLSYDAVFIALLRAAVTGEQPEVSKIRCLRHPFCRRAAAEPCDAVDSAAVICTLLACGKLADDAADERGMRRFGARTAGRFLSRAAGRAGRLAVDAAAAVSNGMRELAEAEQRCSTPESASIDIPAAISGRMIGNAAAAGLDGAAARIVRAAASAAGRWLYCVDAADDLAEDRKHGRFNPISLLYGRGTLTPDEALTFSCTLSAELDAARAALDLADAEMRTRAPEAWAICENILTLGMPRAAAGVTDKITEKTAPDAGTAPAPAGKEKE